MDRWSSKTVQPQHRKADAPYTSRIIKAGALLADTKTLLSHWDVTRSVQDNLDRIRRENVFGKASRSRVEDILAIFRQRYLVEAEVTQGPGRAGQEAAPRRRLDRILYFHAARADRCCTMSSPSFWSRCRPEGLIDIDVDEVQKPLATMGRGRQDHCGMVREHDQAGSPRGFCPRCGTSACCKGPSTSGSHRLTCPSTAFAYIVFYLKQHQPSGAKLVEHPDWKLFFLTREGVERFLFEAHQQRSAGIPCGGQRDPADLPRQTLEEYAHVLAQRAH